GPRAGIGRMAVAEHLRGGGVGAAVLGLLEATAQANGWPEVELHAQVQARRFYERLGYTAVGEVYLEADIEHVTMRKQWS
ncbi:MAG: putative acetyltransferase, partial [Frankiales bacterium]|nr:putative acetyltransferase [Frankiales bacterium]